MTAAILVPRRADHGWRDKLWEYVEPHWREMGYDLTEGHHDIGPFNRGAAINLAARVTKGDLLIIVDADTIVRPAQVERGLELAADTGHLVVCHDRWVGLTQGGTEAILRGYTGNWDRYRRLIVRNGLSSCIVVPRELFDAVGGFDERFQGWGFEDHAFARACEITAGPIERVPGPAYHLHHPDSPERNRKLPGYQANADLAARYRAATTPDDLAELHRPPAVTVMVPTNGRRDCIVRTIPSFEAAVTGNFARRIIHDDSGDPDYQAWLRIAFPDWELMTTAGRTGYDRAYHARVDVLAHTETEWCFVCEDDFLFHWPVDLAGMMTVMDDHRYLLQMVLMRQPWFEPELAAGGVIEALTDRYTFEERIDDAGHQWTEHRAYASMNPVLMRTATLKAHRWPLGAASEHRWGLGMMTDPAARYGIWGPRAQWPTVEHIGVERLGAVY